VGKYELPYRNGQPFRVGNSLTKGTSHHRSTLLTTGERQFRREYTVTDRKHGCIRYDRHYDWSVMGIPDSEISNTPGDSGYNPYRYAQLHPSPEIARLLAEDKAKSDAIRTAEGNRIIARLREQARSSEGQSTLTTDVIAHEKFDGKPIQELEIDAPIPWRRK